MVPDTEKHNRRSIRLRGYDYSQQGMYYFTLCTQNRDCLFGEVLDDEMELNDSGKMIEKWYGELSNKYPDIQCDVYVIMPNHIHAIIHNVGADLCVCPHEQSQDNYFTRYMTGEHLDSPLHRIVQWFKTMTTNEYIRGVKLYGWTPFSGKLWQRNYWERIIRDENELNRIRDYILNNPPGWAMDDENPKQWK